MGGWGGGCLQSGFKELRYRSQKLFKNWFFLDFLMLGLSTVKSLLMKFFFPTQDDVFTVPISNYATDKSICNYEEKRFNRIDYIQGSILYMIFLWSCECTFYLFTSMSHAAMSLKLTIPGILIHLHKNLINCDISLIRNRYNYPEPIVILEKKLLNRRWLVQIFLCGKRPSFVLTVYKATKTR